MSVPRGIVALLLLLAGVAIYVCFRPKALMNGFWTDDSVQIHHTMPDWIIYSLPDALWYAALLALQPHAWWKYFPSVTGILSIIAILIPFLHEGMQFLGIVPGTFCSTDILLYFITFITYITICISLNALSGLHK